MMKMMILAPRRPGMARAEFRDYLLTVHGPLVRNTAAVAKDILQYHYNFPLPAMHDPIFGHPVAAELDVVTEGWFASRAAQRRNMAEPDYQTIVHPDEGRFADEANAVMHCTHEVPIAAGAPTLRKLFYFRRRREDLSREAFQTRWRAAMTEIVGESPAFAQTVARYVQNHTLSDGLAAVMPDPRRYDVLEAWSLADGGDATNIAGEAALVGAVRALEQELLAQGSTRAIMAETVVNID